MEASTFNMGTATSPDGEVIEVNSRCLLRNGRPWMPVMGEFHYSRYPAAEWRGELLKMKAGGIDIVATYVFWIHHEESKGDFDWTGRRNLGEFVRTAGEVGLDVIVRCGPWCHGEVRNGGIPDWVLAEGLKVRTEDPAYLKRARILYHEIAGQLKGLLWKDGGPVIGIQLENEYGGPAEHLLSLKRIARDTGLDVPLYTRTGWPALSTPIPFGEILPLYGVYAEGFWDREISSMPGRYWSGFHFSTLRTNANIANDILGRRDVRDDTDAAFYPYLTCEIGGGMMNSYHRRILIDAADVEATTLVKLGSGGNSPGYYMYHGGTNPEGRFTTLMEEQETSLTNWNDMPVKNYDFQAPLGEYGQVRAHYHWLRRLHLFLRDFGTAVGLMDTHLPGERPQGKDDVTTLRWSVRSNGDGGMLFVNNYERARNLPAKENVQFTVNSHVGTVVLPSSPVTVASGSRFFWPFHFDLGHGAKITYATAQPICMLDGDGIRTVFFAETPGVPAEFLIGDGPPKLLAAGRSSALAIDGADGARVRIVLLSDADSLALYKANWLGCDRVFLTRSSLSVDGDRLRVTAHDRADLSVSVFPAPDGLRGETDGLMTKIELEMPDEFHAVSNVELIQTAGPVREIPSGPNAQPVAMAPRDDDFAAAAVWRVRLPADLDLSADPLLRIRYAGDVARITLDGKLITDDFYNGGKWEIGLRRHAPEILNGDLRLAILPLRKDATTSDQRKIFLSDSAIPDFGESESIVALESLEIVPRYSAEFNVRSP